MKAKQGGTRLYKPAQGGFFGPAQWKAFKGGRVFQPAVVS
jgi:hypothetical protein